MTLDHPLWPHIAILTLALAPLVWMGWQYLNGWPLIGDE